MRRELIITSSQQKKREYEKLNILNNTFTDVMTLDELIAVLYDKNFTHSTLDPVLIPSIMHELIQENSIAYFQYVKNDGQSINLISDFIQLCNRNNCSPDVFQDDKDKTEALALLAKVYSVYKANNKLNDIGDIEKHVYQLIQDSTDCFSLYSDLYIDDFSINNVRFYKSWYQEEIVKTISKKFKKLPLVVNDVKPCILYRPHKECFNKLDEMRTALKITRKVLESGVSSDGICIVTSSIKEYAPLFRILLEEYGLKGYDTLGTPLSLYRSPSKHPNEKVSNAYRQHKLTLKTYESFAKRYNISINIDSIDERLRDTVYIHEDRFGIMLTEPNQVAGLKKRYSHIIFVGTDMTHFPPKSDDNFLYTVNDAIENFYLNSAYVNSLYHFNELQKLSDHLYILQPSYEGKRKLSPSILIPHDIENVVGVAGYESLNELYLSKKVGNVDEHIMNFTSSLRDPKFTKFDGCNVQDIKVNHLSASQINTYLACPLKYLYNNKLGLQAPRSSEEGFDAAEAGSLMHLCFEYFGKYIKEHGESDDLYGLMHLMSIEAYSDFLKENEIEPNIYHEITLRDLQKGLVNEDPKNLLAKFVDYYTSHETRFDLFKGSEFEKQFLLDRNLYPTTDESLAFIKGYIDRIDTNNTHVTVIDYKSKKMSSDVDSQKQEQVNQLKDVQLALYILYAKQSIPDKKYDAHLLSFKGEKPYYKFASLNNTADGVYTPEYEAKLKTLINDTCMKIETGQFAFDDRDEKVCEYCDIKLMCYAENLSKSYDEEIQ